MAKVGTAVECWAGAIPDGLVRFDILGPFPEDVDSQALFATWDVPAECWDVIVVLAGSLRFEVERLPKVCEVSCSTRPCQQAAPLRSPIPPPLGDSLPDNCDPYRERDRLGRQLFGCACQLRLGCVRQRGAEQPIFVHLRDHAGLPACRP